MSAKTSGKATTITGNGWLVLLLWNIAVGCRHPRTPKRHHLCPLSVLGGASKKYTTQQSLQTYAFTVQCQLLPRMTRNSSIPSVRVVH